MIEKILPSTIISVVATTEMWQQSCYPEEWALVDNAVSKRQKEFQAGRNCARQALSQLGIENHPVLSGSRREPVWPESVVGSITHCKDYCAAALSTKSAYIAIGIDAEEKTPLDNDSLDLVCTLTEKTWLNKHGLANSYWSKVIFSAKESLFKCYYPLTHQYLDFLDAEFTLDPDNNTFNAKIPGKPGETFNKHKPINGRFLIDDHYIYTSLVLPCTTRLAL